MGGGVRTIGGSMTIPAKDLAASVAASASVAAAAAAAAAAAKLFADSKDLRDFFDMRLCSSSSASSSEFGRAGPSDDAAALDELERTLL
jgi:outer membrane lipoprotein-sorting protein